MESTMIPMSHDWAGKEWDWPLQHEDGTVKVNNTADHFDVQLDCQFFTPKEIEVRVAGDQLVVHGRHELRSGPSGMDIAREVHRSYKLPSDVDPKSLKSNLDNRGVLCISAAKKKM
uniref:SHSP domain-containing protein n=1 Tax=Plectus sambesii TaxID=2011161 RepID=A0A914VMA1_9BILA